jgi:hypothetical protein
MTPEGQTMKKALQFILGGERQEAMATLAARTARGCTATVSPH